jgi:very-short-patch-repair endonuclease
MTKQEVKLWVHLRDAQLGGFSFRRQHPAGPYYLDFYCAKTKLAVELDGSQHATAEGQAHDAARTRYLARQGIRVLRFCNTQIDGDDMRPVLVSIQSALEMTPPARLRRATSPFHGEDKNFR